MQWIIILCGLMMLAMLAKTQTPSPAEFYSSLAFHEMTVLLSETAKQAKEQGYATLPVRRGMSRKLKGCFRYWKASSKKAPSAVAQLLRQKEQMLLSTVSEAVQQCRSLPMLPRSQKRFPRLCLFACIISQSDEPLTAASIQEAIAAWQAQEPMTESELTAIPAVLTLMLTEAFLQLTNQSQSIVDADKQVHTIVRSLLAVPHLPWKHILDDCSTIHRMLSQDAVYRKMDEQSQLDYRHRAAQIARRCRRAERTVCNVVLSLCRSGSSSAAASHAGYYLLDDGFAALLARLNVLTPWRRTTVFLSRRSFEVVRLLTWTVFIALIGVGFFSGCAIIMLPPLAAVFMIMFQTHLLFWCHRRFPKKHPRIALEQLPDHCPVLVICYAVLQSADHALEMVRQMAVMHEANPDEQVHFMLLGDFQDSLTTTALTDSQIISSASEAIDLLNAAGGHSFWYLQRERSHTAGEKSCHGRNRRSGAVELLLHLLNGRSVHDRIAFSNVDPAALFGKYRFVITLDEDSVLPPGSILNMAGAMLHPLHSHDVHYRHHGISQLLPAFQNDPFRTETAFSRLISNPPAFIPDAAFKGVGMMDLQAYQENAADLPPQGAVLDAGLLETAIAGCNEDRRIRLLSRGTQTPGEFLQRQHTCIRSLWQLLPYLIPFIGLRGRLDQKARFQLWGSLMQSLLIPMQMLTMLYAVMTGREWLAAALTFLPQLWLLFPCSLSSCKRYLIKLSILPWEAFVHTDAILRTFYQLLFSRKQLTYLPLKTHQHQPSMLLFILSMTFAGLFAGAPLLLGGAWTGLLPAGFWAFFPFLLPALEQKTHGPQPTGYMREVLLRLAQRTFSFFETVITDSDHGLPPANVQIEPNTGITHRTSPDSIGLYLCSLLAAHRLKLITTDVLCRRMSDTIVSLEQLPKWNGLFYAAYDTQHLTQITSADISSEHCGTLAVCLLTCAQGLRTLIPDLPPIFHDLALRMDRLCCAMQLDKLYDAEADLAYVSLDPTDDLPSSAHHELLASESRLLSFAAIMLRRFPIRHWHTLKRPRTHSGLLLSRYGSMAEFLFPLLFQSSAPHTLLEHAARRAVRLQRRRKLGSAFGISTCHYHTLDSAQHYQHSPFGVPELALETPAEVCVLSPCASMLCLPLELKAAFRNLQRLQQLGLEGPLGLFDAADFSPARTSGKPLLIVRSHTARHQGMILCAVCNTLCDRYISRLFSSLPKVQAYQILLDEPV